MLRLIIEKELRDILGSRKFAATFAVCSLLLLLAFLVGAMNYHADVARFEAAKRQNLKQMEGLTDWVMVRSNRIFLPPQPLASLVSGVAHDLAQTTEVRGRGDLPQTDSRYGDEPVFAAFRFLDLEFIMQMVFSLFAILFAYDAISGEKERGTLGLTFANPLPRHVYLAGKFIGTYAALALPLLVPLLLGALLLLSLGVPMSGDDWVRGGLIAGTGLMFLGAFVALSLAVSALTVRSSTSFLVLLVIWIFSVLIVPRSAIILAGRSVEVPSVDEIGAKKSRLNRQLWTEDREKMRHFNGTGEPQKVLANFQKFMGDMADAREKRMTELSTQLTEERENKERIQEALAFSLARISPSACFTLAATNLAGTGLGLKAHYRDEARAYQQTYGKFLLEKTGMNPGGGMVFRIVQGNGEKPAPIDPRELPPFVYRPQTLGEVLPAALPDMGILALFGLAFFAVAHIAFLRYDLR